MVSGNSLRHGDVGGGRAGGGVDGADIHGRTGRDIAQELRLRPAVKCLAGDKERRGRDMGFDTRDLLAPAQLVVSGWFWAL